MKAEQVTGDRHHVGRIAAALRPRGQGGAVIGVERAQPSMWPVFQYASLPVER